MKKAFWWIGGLLLSPILLFVILTILLYLPFVQKWAVGKVAVIASEETGMQIDIGHVGLSFPLDLEVERVSVVKETDTLANIGRAVVDIQLWKLIAQKVVVDELSVCDASVNTIDLIPDVQVKGQVGLLSVRSRGIDLGDGIVELNGAMLADANLTVFMSDTAAVDTTTSEPLPWLIRMDSLTVQRSQLVLHLPGDSMVVGVGMERLRLEEGIVDLLNSHYTVRALEWTGGEVSYDQTFEQPVTDGFDYNHITLSGLCLCLDSIYFQTPNLGLKIRQGIVTEKSGLQITSLQGMVLMDSMSIRLPRFLLTTPYSNLQAKAHVDLNVMDSVSPGQMHLDLNAALGKQDLMLFAKPALSMSEFPVRTVERFDQQWPEWPLAITGRVDGNMQRMSFDNLEATLPTAFHVALNGQVENVTDTDRLLAQLDLSAETYNLGVATALADPKLMQDYRIPNGIRLAGKMKTNGQRHAVEMVASQGRGTIRVKGWFDQKTMSYDTNLDINGLNLHHFMPKDSLYELTANAKVRGHGTDFMSNKSWIEADARIIHFQYAQLPVDSIQATVRLHDGHALANVSGNNRLMDGSLGIDALLGTNDLRATLSADLTRLDFQSLQLAETPLTVGLCGHLDVESNLKERHRVSGLIGEIYIKDSLDLFRPDDIGLTARTQADTTIFRLQTGDMIVKADASGGYELLMEQLMTLTDTIMSQVKNRTIDQMSIKRSLPVMRLYMTSGRNNPIANFLKASGNIQFKELHVDMYTSAAKGMNGDLQLLSLNADSIRIDTIKLHLRDREKKGLTFQGQVTNNRRNPQFVFNALVDGNLHEHGANVGVRFFDDKNTLGLRIGARADMEQDGLRMRLMPERPTIGYQEFTLNKDNFLFVGQNDFKLQAKIDLLSDDGTGVKIYSEDQNPSMLQDLTVSLHRFDLDKFTTALPYVPRITGILDGDFHLTMNQQEQISVASDMQVAKMTYEESPLGNVSTEFVYMQREDDTHAIEAILMLEGREALSMRGSYQNKDEGYLDATLKFIHTPMSIANGFVPDHLIGLEGYAEGEMSVKGAMSKPVVNGEVMLDSAALVSVPYGMRLRFDDDPVRVVGSKLLLENFTMYAHNDNPLNIMGNIDFHDLDRINMDVRMRATNFQLVNAKQNKESIAFGKAFVNFYAMMSGRLDQLSMRGKLDVLGNTDLTYLLLDSPISTDNHIEELVKFTDFTDSTLTVVEKPKPEGLNVSINISIDQGTHVKCGLNSDMSNYVDLFGGGDMRMKYTNEEMTLTGRYTINNGEMKYSLPIIPLKTFTIQDGSYVEFTGDIMNPRLNLTATERTKATVAEEGQASRSVTFGCGVVITKTLQDMGLEFIISAPEDMTISSELNSMTVEQRGKLAVTMLTTGMYLADGNTGGFSMNSALSSFLQSEINSLTGSALRTLDLNFGVDNTTDATGASHTDYSFKFAKRFWNNRIRVQIGGKVSTGNDMQGQKQSFFDNVTMEYRLTPTSNQYAKLFYNQNVYDWLDGYTGQYGVGYMWKRQLSTFMEIFKIWGNNTSTQNNNLRMTTDRNHVRTDSVQTIKAQ
jgi:hypothetical protein